MIGTLVGRYLCRLVFYSWRRWSGANMPSCSRAAEGVLGAWWFVSRQATLAKTPSRASNLSMVADMARLASRIVEKKVSLTAIKMNMGLLQFAHHMLTPA